MKIIFSTFIFLFLINCKSSTSHTKSKTYKIIIENKNSGAKIDSLEITRLSEPLKALASFYSAMGGTNCSNDECDLTSALGLDKQGSEKHKELIRKYFPNDKAAAAVILQDCYLRPSGASTFSEFEYLTIIDFEDRVEVEYNLMYWDHGKISYTRGPDIYSKKDNVFFTIKRKLWSDYK